MSPAIRLCGIGTGGGTTIGKIREAIVDRRLGGVELGLIIATKPTSGVIKLMKDAGYPDRDVVVLPQGWSKNRQMLIDFILEECRKREINFVGLYGCLVKMPEEVINAFLNMIVNQHPGPLSPESPPGFDFGGEKMFGNRVTDARIRFVRAVGRDPWTRVVAHRVTPEFDRGQVVGEEQVDLYRWTTVESVADQRLAAEYRVQIETLRRFAERRVVPIVRQAFSLVRKDELDLLNRCKAEAVAAYPNG